MNKHGFISQYLSDKAPPYVADASVVSEESSSKKRAQDRQLRIKVFTLNINGEDLPDKLGDLLDYQDAARKATLPDIVVFCFQESMKLSVRRITHDLFSGSHREKHCERLRESLERNLPDTYRECHSEAMVGLFIVTFCSQQLEHSIQYAQSAIVARGIAGLGNKGAIAIRLRIDSTILVFVNAHLAASEDEIERRNADIEAIGTSLSFPALPKTDSYFAWREHSRKGVALGQALDKSAVTSPTDKFDPEQETRAEANHRFDILDSDYLFMAGDLNYRIALEHDEVIRLISDRRYELLLEKDQLNLERQKGNIFRAWSEGKITFRPTYKFDKTRDPNRQYDTSDKHRTPSYTDRILFHTGRAAKAIEVEEYRSHEDILCSDHLPISLTVIVHY